MFQLLNRFVDKSTERFINEDMLFKDELVDLSTKPLLRGKIRRFIVNTGAVWIY